MRSRLALLRTSLIHSVATALVFAAFLPTALSSAQTSSGGCLSGIVKSLTNAPRTDAALIELYYVAKTKGLLQGAKGGAAEQELGLAIDQSLRQRLAHVPETVWRNLSFEDRVMLLEDQVYPQSTSGVKVTLTASQRAEILRRPAVIEFVKKWTQADVGSTEANMKFLELVAKPEKGRLFAMSGTANLKALNDIVFGEKTMPNALTNFAKNLMAERIAKDPVLAGRVKILGVYADYKNLFYAFDNDGAPIRTRIAEIYNDVMKEYGQTVEKLPIDELYGGLRGRLNSNPRSWNLGGMGATADEASLAARYGRQYGGSNGVPLQDFSQVSQILDLRVQRIENLRSTLQQQLGAKSDVLTRVPKSWNEYVLSTEAAEVLRKVKDTDFQSYAKSVRESFKKRFAVDLTDAQIRNMREYYKLADGFSPEVFTPERVRIDLGQADHGVVSADFAGQGAHNATENMIALQRASSRGIQGVLEEARPGFDRASGRLTGLGKIVRKAVEKDFGSDSKVLFSGDDGIFMPKTELNTQDKLRFVRDLSKQAEKPADLRITFVPSKFRNGAIIPKPARSAFVVGAEMVEKDIRANLEGKLGLSTSRQMLIAIDLVPETEGTGQINLILGGKIDPAAMQKIRDAFSKSLPDGYRMGDIVTEFPSHAPVSSWTPRFGFYLSDASPSLKRALVCAVITI